MSTQKKTGVAAKIQALRGSLGLSQEQFAKALGVTRVAALHWESGRSEPGAATYIALARLVKDSDRSLALWFWEQAGIDVSTLRALVPEFERSLKAFGRQQRERTGATYKIPVLANPASLRKPIVEPEEIKEWVYVDGAHVPATARGLYVGKQWMSHPREGDILVLDADRIVDANNAQTALSGLKGRLLAAFVGGPISQERIVASTRLSQSALNPGSAAETQILPGVTVGWLEIWKVVDATERFEARLLAGLHTHLVGFKGAESTEFQLYSDVEFIAPVFQWITAAKEGSK